MDRPLRLLLISHGLPPRENAGTEQHVDQLARALAARGHALRVLAATRDPAHPPYARLDEAPQAGLSVCRIVQNLPTRALASAERDLAVEALVQAEVRAFRPDLVHVHHLQFLSSGLRFPVPTVLSLHDAWTWCAAGGQELDMVAGGPCPGPSPARCAPCAAAWAPRPSGAARLLLAGAGRLSPLVPPTRAHAAFALLPEGLRRALQRPHRGRPSEPARAAQDRNAAMAAFVHACALRLAPSRFLAARAEALGLGPVEVLPHGVDGAAGPPPEARRGPVLFLGTIAAHKGPDRVVQAWRQAFPGGQPGLRVHGQVQDPRLLLGHPAGPVLDRAGVQAALHEARALVMGSIWPENAPLVALEARRAGCPVLAPAIGGLPELVEHGRDGFLYPPGDTQALAQAMGRLLDEAGQLAPRPPPTHAAQVDATLAHYQRLLGGGP